MPLPRVFVTILQKFVFICVMDHKSVENMVMLAMLGMLVMAWYAHGDSIVSGNVFCDQCLHGRPSMWGVPIHGAKVLVHCRSKHGAVLVSPASTSFIGAFVAKFSGNHELQHCSSRLLWSPLRECNVVVSAQESLRLEWKMYDDAFYTVKPLYFKPVRPMSGCPVARPKVSPIVVPKAPSAHMKLPSDHPSFCRVDHWMNPFYRCHWKFVTPERTIGEILGRQAEERFGNITFLQALHEHTGLRNNTMGERYVTAYNALLSETVAALLNSYFSSMFDYSPFIIARNFNDAISRDSPRDATRLAVEFRKANAGLGKGTCLLQVCKNN